MNKKNSFTVRVQLLQKMELETEINGINVMHVVAILEGGINQG